jgi:iron complex transport system substrate-binding protein
MRNRCTFGVRSLGSLVLIAMMAAATSAVSAQEPAQRVLTIGGSLTEIVYALGEEDRLVGRDQTSQYPAEAGSLPDVGYMRALSPEGVLSIDPDLIIALEGAGPREAMEVIEAASVPIVTVPERYDAKGVIAKIEAVGAALGVPDKALELAERVRGELEAAATIVRSAEDPATVLFILSLEGGRIMASGTGTAADGMIVLAGGENAIGDFAGYKQLTDEAIIDAAPDVILLMDRGGATHDPAVNDIAAHPALSATPAAQSGRIIRMDGSYLLGFGPRTAKAMTELSRALYPPSDAVAQ